MGSSERGFTLIEVLVAVGIMALLAAAGGVWMLATRPAALRAAVDGYDASMASALALAATGGNGATLVFRPRTDGRGSALAGFTLDVYGGRPTGAGAVSASGTMRVVSDASVVEKTLGTPPFALFLSTAGHPSGQAAYPPTGANGSPAFPAIAQQPPCPAGGFILTFTGPQGARDIRTLACSTSAFASAAPNPSPTPNTPLLTPQVLAFDWPSAPQQIVVATEWGYTHWFASASGFACANGNATNYASIALPYQAPHDANETSVAPPAPGDTPYSYPNSPQSMNDAPAPFPVVPAQPGGCTLDIVDAYAQHATAIVHVRGPMTALPNALAWPAPTDHGERDAVLAKSDDDEALRPSILADTCTGIARVRWASQNAPASWTDTASAVVGIEPVTGSNGYNIGGSCAITIASQYTGEPPVTIAINIAKPPAPMASWPEQITMGAGGSPVAFAPDSGIDLAALLNRALGGGAANAGTSGCYAYALTTGGAADLPEPAQAIALGISVDPVSGCYLSGGAPTAQAQVALWEPSGNSETFNVSQPCSYVSNGPFYPGSAGAKVSLPVAAGSTPGTCQIGITDGVTTPTVDHGLTNVQVLVPDGCVSDQTCGVVLYQIFNTCSGNALSGYIFDYHASTTYYTSLDGGTTWTLTYSKGYSYGAGRGSSCPVAPGESPTAAGPPPAGDIINFMGVRAGTTGTGTITWSPSSPPAYITAYFGV
ncbi:MAG: type II secretion system protein [Vulcanimicrobiaceae bacterium]